MGSGGRVVRCVWFFQASTRKGRSELEKEQHSTGLATPCFSFFLLLVCDSLFDVTRKAVGNMGYFPVAGDVCVAGVSPVSGAALSLYNIVNCATPRDLKSPQPHTPPAPR